MIHSLHLLIITPIEDSNMKILNIHKSDSDIHTLMKVALGEIPADIIIQGANMVNVYTGEILKDQTIATKGQWIAHVGKYQSESQGDKTTIIDAHGKFVIPGLVDAHAHLAWLFTISEFLRYAIPGGTTTIITESMEVYPVGGISGMNDFLSSLSDQPIKIFATAPAMGSISSNCLGVPEDNLRQILSHPNVIGLGELYWQNLLDNPSRFLSEIQLAMSMNKSVEGHTAGAKGRKLQAYTCTGISSCHESISEQEALDRMRLGIHVMVRQGSIREDLEAIAGIKNRGIDLRRLVICTDGVEPQRLISRGYMESVLQDAIDYGMDPIVAIQCATLNPAEHFGLDHLIGGIAPGRCADMLILEDLKRIKPEVVISNGRIIAKNGKVLSPPRKHTYARQSKESIMIQGPVSDEIFHIMAPGAESHVKVRAIKMITDLVTQEIHIEMPVINGQLVCDLERDILKISAIDRSKRNGKIFNGFILGFGIKDGAMASSSAWDTSDIIVVGTNDQDMAIAVNRIIDMGGGSVISSGGKVIEELPLPIYGIISDLSIEKLACKTRSLTDSAHALGVKFPDPFLSLITLTGAAIPYLRICEEGLVNLKHGKTMGLFV
jgi:adenine deaminase